MDIRLDDLIDRRVQDLLVTHLAGMHESSPPGTVYALDLSGLKSPDMSVWTAWNGDELMGIGALKQLSPASGEIKSMRTDSQHLRKGVGLSILNHIIAEALHRGYQRLSLETGSGEAFEPALNMYRNSGFKNGEAFGGYTPSAFNQFLHLELSQGGDCNAGTD